MRRSSGVTAADGKVAAYAENTSVITNNLKRERETTEDVSSSLSASESALYPPAKKRVAKNPKTASESELTARTLEFVKKSVNFDLTDHQKEVVEGFARKIRLAFVLSEGTEKRSAKALNETWEGVRKTAMKKYLSDELSKAKVVIEGEERWQAKIDAIFGYFEGKGNLDAESVRKLTSANPLRLWEDAYDSKSKLLKLNLGSKLEDYANRFESWVKNETIWLMLKDDPSMDLDLFDTTATLLRKSGTLASDAFYEAKRDALERGYASVKRLKLDHNVETVKWLQAKDELLRACLEELGEDPTKREDRSRGKNFSLGSNFEKRVARFSGRFLGLGISKLLPAGRRRRSGVERVRSLLLAFRKLGKSRLEDSSRRALRFGRRLRFRLDVGRRSQEVPIPDQRSRLLVGRLLRAPFVSF